MSASGRPKHFGKNIYPVQGVVTSQWCPRGLCASTELFTSPLKSKLQYESDTVFYEQLPRNFMPQYQLGNYAKP